MIKDEIQFLTLAFALLTGFLFIMLTYLIVRKAVEIRLRNKIEVMKDSMNEKLLHSILTGDFLRSLQTDTNAKRLAMEELLSHYAEILEGDEEIKNLNHLAVSFLSTSYRKSLKNNKWSTRMNALLHIEVFRMEVLMSDTLVLLKRSRVTKEEKIRALTILAELQYKGMFALLTEEHNDLSHLDYRNILSRLDDKGFEQFVLGYHSCQQQLKYAILDLTGTKKDLAYLQFIETVFLVSSGEERLRALKAISSIGYARNMERYLPLLKSSNWEERMLAARLAGTLKAEEALPELVELLQDPSWWVRSQAGKSITLFPQGKKILQGVMETSSDSFAKDMAWEWINKGEFQS